MRNLKLLLILFALGVLTIAIYHLKIDDSETIVSHLLFSKQNTNRKNGRSKITHDYNQKKIKIDAKGKIVYPRPKEYFPGDVSLYYMDIIDTEFSKLINESISLNRLQNYQECREQWKGLTDSQFLSLDNWDTVYAFSAYLDEYLDESLFIIRVIIFKDTKDTRKIYGSFGNQIKVESYNLRRSKVGLHQLNTYRPESWRGYLATFSIGKKFLHNKNPCVIDVSVGESQPISLPIRRTKIKEKMYKNTICIAPVFNGNKFSPAHILEYLVMLSRIGIEKAVIYLGTNVPWFWKEIFTNNYTSGLRVEFVKWYLPSSKVFRLGQELMTNECLFREMGSSTYLSFFDLDEMIVPASKYDTVNNALDAYFGEFPSRDFVCFYNVFYPTYFIENKNQTRNVYFMYEIRKKCDYLNGAETKCIIRPERIRQMAVHQPIADLNRFWPTRKLKGTEDYAICRHYTIPRFEYCNIYDSDQISNDESIEKFLNASTIVDIEEKVDRIIQIISRNKFVN